MVSPTNGLVIWAPAASTSPESWLEMPSLPPSLRPSGSQSAFAASAETRMGGSHSQDQCLAPEWWSQPRVPFHITLHGHRTGYRVLTEILLNYNQKKCTPSSIGVLIRNFSSIYSQRLSCCALLTWNRRNEQNSGSLFTSKDKNWDWSKKNGIEIKTIISYCIDEIMDIKAFFKLQALKCTALIIDFIFMSLGTISPILSASMKLTQNLYNLKSFPVF